MDRTSVLVTGGAGFIGSHLADTLLARGHRVRVLDDLSTGDEGQVPAGAELVVGDVADASTTNAVARDVEVVFHLAALGAVARSVEDPLATDAANVHGTVAVLDAARRHGVRRVVFASSSSVYGGTAPLPTPEDAPLRPRSPYAVSKLAGEQYCRVFSELTDLETVALRFFNVYGPRQRPDSIYAAVIPRFTAALLAGEQPTVHGDGLQSRDFTFVGDVCAAVEAAAEAPAERCDGRAFNVAGGRRATVLEMLGLLGGLLGVEPRPVHTEPRIGDVRHSQADVSAIADALGHRCAVDLRDGLARTVAWARGAGGA
jgi:nucleoside-diphosphate-sugar epimerase